MVDYLLGDHFAFLRHTLWCTWNVAVLCLGMDKVTVLELFSLVLATPIVVVHETRMK